MVRLLRVLGPSETPAVPVWGHLAPNALLTPFSLSHSLLLLVFLLLWPPDQAHPQGAGLIQLQPGPGLQALSCLLQSLLPPAGPRLLTAWARALFSQRDALLSPLPLRWWWANKADFLVDANLCGLCSWEGDWEVLMGGGLKVSPRDLLGPHSQRGPGNSNTQKHW